MLARELHPFHAFRVAVTALRVASGPHRAALGNDVGSSVNGSRQSSATGTHCRARSAGLHRSHPQRGPVHAGIGSAYAGLRPHRNHEEQAPIAGKERQHPIDAVVTRSTIRCMPLENRWLVLGLFAASIGIVFVHVGTAGVDQGFGPHHPNSFAARSPSIGCGCARYHVAIRRSTFAIRHSSPRCSRSSCC